MKYIIELRAPVAQLDRAPPSGGGGCGFDPRWVHHFFSLLHFSGSVLTNTILNLCVS